MYKFVTVVLLSLLLFQDEPKINWSQSLQLEWTDFKGVPVEGTTVVAVTASGLSFGFSTKRTNDQLSDYTFNVEAQFYPDKSWYLKGRADDNILSHERLHFDITELHARKFRKRISNTKFTNNISKEMEAIYKTINEELTAMQNLYDEETNHSQNLKVQHQWETKVTLALEKLAYYSSR
jgi:hypothetical protein